jgi:hypothetical protein
MGLFVGPVRESPSQAKVDTDKAADFEAVLTSAAQTQLNVQPQVQFGFDTNTFSATVKVDIPMPPAETWRSETWPGGTEEVLLEDNKVTITEKPITGNQTQRVFVERQDGGGPVQTSGSTDRTYALETTTEVDPPNKFPGEETILVSAGRGGALDVVVPTSTGQVELYGKTDKDSGKLDDSTLYADVTTVDQSTITTLQTPDTVKADREAAITADLYPPPIALGPGMI